MKASGKAGYGSGWHKQSLRHSRAKSTGKAGGKYADRFYSVKGFPNMVVSKLNEQNNEKGLSYVRVIHGDIDAVGRKIKYGEQFQTKSRDLKLLSQSEAMKKTLLKDSDGDGVPDKYDCQPNNPKKQDVNPQAVPFNKEKLTEQEVKLLLRRINAKKIDPSEDLPRLDDYGWELTDSQIEKGKAWLNKHRTSMGLREEAVMDTFESISLIDFYSERGDYKYPVYQVHGKESNFDYVVIGGELKIIG